MGVRLGSRRGVMVVEFGPGWYRSVDLLGFFFFLDDEKDEKRSILGRIDIYTEAHWDDCNNLS